ncbi:MAG: ABC transporter substrate-binding protein [Phycisphaerales bacterium]
MQSVRPVTTAGAILRALGVPETDPAPVLPCPRGVEDVLDHCLLVGDALGRVEQARRLVVELRNRLFTAAEHVNPYADGPSVAVIIGADPVQLGGRWVAQLVERAGGRYPWIPAVPNPLAGEAVGPQQGERLAGDHRPLGRAEFVTDPPDALVICPNGMDIEAASRFAAALVASPGFVSTPAVLRGKVAVVDGIGTFGVPGPALADCFEWLVGWLHDRPELMPRSLAWRRLDGG